MMMSNPTDAASQAEMELTSAAVSSSSTSHSPLCAPRFDTSFFFLLENIHVIERCIGFLNQTERVHAAQVSHALYSACCSPPYSVAASQMIYVRSQQLLPQASRSKLSVNAHRVHVNMDGESHAPLDLHYLRAWKHLSHFGLGASPNMELLSVGENGEAAEMMEVWPQTLKSCSICVPHSAPAAASKLFPLLPSTLEFLDITISGTPSATCFAAALTHLRIRDCGIFNTISPNFDWASQLHHLTSLFVERFRANSSHCFLPLSVGARVLTLEVDQIENEIFQPEPVFDKHGLTNLTSLTFHCSLPSKWQILDEVPNLTFLSLKREQFPDFTGFAKLRKLQNLSIRGWPSCYVQFDPYACPMGWNWAKINGAITACLNDSLSDSLSASLPQKPCESLADYFPSLTQLSAGDTGSSYDARDYLLSIPHLQQIKWGRQPWLHPNEIKTYYTIDAIAQREAKMQQESFDKQPKNPMQSEPITDLPLSSSTIARQFNSFHLSLAFQCLTPAELARISIVNKHWRTTALNPLVMRRALCVEVHESTGVTVHGPQAIMTDEWMLERALRSTVFRQVPALSIQFTRIEYAFLRESWFASKFLRMLLRIPLFTNLQVLSVNWEPRKDTMHYQGPTPYDLKNICHVLESSALKNLKVLRLKAPSHLMYLLLQMIPKLNALEVVELCYTAKPSDMKYVDCPDEHQFAKPLLQLPQLRQLSIGAKPISDFERPFKFGFAHLEELSQFCTGVSSQFEELYWRGTITQDQLILIADKCRQDPSFLFPHLRSIHIPSLQGSLNALSNASAAMPHLTDVSVSAVHLGPELPPESPLAAPLAARLRSFKLSVEIRDRVKGKYLIPLLKSLIASKLGQLECLHLARDYYAPSKPVHPDELTVNELLSHLLLSVCSSLIELNCSSFSMPHHFWNRILPPLRIVHANRVVLARLDQCLQMRQLHLSAPPNSTELSKLLKLPYFESLTYSQAIPPFVMKLTREEVRLKVQALGEVETPDAITSGDSALFIPSFEMVTSPPVAVLDESDELLAEFLASIRTSE